VWGLKDVLEIYIASTYLLRVQTYLWVMIMRCIMSKLGGFPLADF
jgi:hypothetical protein